MPQRMPITKPSGGRLWGSLMTAKKEATVMIILTLIFSSIFLIQAVFYDLLLLSFLIIIAPALVAVLFALDILYCFVALLALVFAICRLKTLKFIALVPVTIVALTILAVFFSS